MPLTQAKDSHFRRMFGTNSQNTKSKYKEMEDWEAQSPFGANDNVLSFLGQPQQQEQAPQQQPQTQYQLYQMMQERPERDTQSEDIIRKRAKVNALSKGFSGLAGLAGMAIGGDAPNVPDYVSPFNENQMMNLDNDYRNRLQNWIDQGFQVDQMNTGLRNQEIEQGINAGNRMAEIDARAQAQLNQLMAKTEVEQIAEMQKAGVDPYSEGAYQQYMDAMKQQFDADVDYTKAKTKWNLRSPMAGRGGSGTPDEDYDLDLMAKGRNRRAEQLKVQRQAELNELTLVKDPLEKRAMKEAINKKYDREEEENRKYKPGANILTDKEILELANMPDDQPMTSGMPQQQRSMNFDPNRGMFTNVDAQNDPVIQQRLSAGLEKALQGSISEEEYFQMIQDLVNAGEAQDEEEAADFIEEFIQDQLKQKK